MVKRSDTDVNGCLFIVGTVVTSTSLGFLYGATVGWLSLGVICLTLGAVNVFGNLITFVKK